MTVHLRLEAGPVQLLIGNHEGTAFVEVIAQRETKNVGGQSTGFESARFELRGVEVTAFARLVELAAPELKRAGGSKR